MLTHFSAGGLAKDKLLTTSMHWLGLYMADSSIVNCQVCLSAEFVLVVLRQAKPGQGYAMIWGVVADCSPVHCQVCMSADSVLALLRGTGRVPGYAVTWQGCSWQCPKQGQLIAALTQPACFRMPATRPWR